MKYKITEISTLEMKVEYEDGSWASIPSVAGYDKVDYLIQIQNMLPTSASEVPIAEHPMKIGDEGVVGEGIPAEEQPDYEWKWDGARAVNMPSYSVQLEALYDSRKGDNTKLDAIDAHIEMVKAKFPKDDKVYSIIEMETATKELQADSKWVED